MLRKARHDKDSSTTDLAERPHTSRRRDVQEISDQKASKVLGAKVVPERSRSSTSDQMQTSQRSSMSLSQPSSGSQDSEQSEVKLVDFSSDHIDIPTVRAQPDSFLHPALQPSVGSSDVIPRTSSAGHPTGRRLSISFAAADWQSTKSDCSGLSHSRWGLLTLSLLHLLTQELVEDVAETFVNMEWITDDDKKKMKDVCTLYSNLIKDISEEDETIKNYDRWALLQTPKLERLYKIARRDAERLLNGIHDKHEHWKSEFQTKQAASQSLDPALKQAQTPDSDCDTSNGDLN